MQEYAVTVDNKGGVFWYKPGTEILHRLGGPAVEWFNGSKYWYQNDKLHRLDGPAIEYANGSKVWCQNGKYHRLDGPAIEYSDGDKEWFQNGKRHRLDGPAIEYANGDKYWYIDDVEYTKEEFNTKVYPSAKELTVAEISELLGYDVKIVKS